MTKNKSGFDVEIYGIQIRFGQRVTVFFCEIPLQETPSFSSSLEEPLHTVSKPRLVGDGHVYIDVETTRIHSGTGSVGSQE